MGPYQIAVSKYIDDVCEELTDKIVWKLQRLKVTLSGEDSGLTNAWDEICVQVQDGRSFYFREYEDVVGKMLLSLLDGVNAHLRVLIWLESDEGQDFLLDYDEDDLNAPDPGDYWVEADIVRYLLKEYVWRKAGAYSNKKIENYLYGV